MSAEETLRPFEDLPFPAEVELGDLAMTIGEILELRKGAILRTDHVAGAPVAVRVGGVALATADVIVIDDSLSIRITKLLDKAKASAGSDGNS